MAATSSMRAMTRRRSRRYPAEFGFNPSRDPLWGLVDGSDGPLRSIRLPAGTPRRHLRQRPMEVGLVTEDELDGITPDDLRGIFLYGCHRLQLNAHGLIPGAHDPDDLQAIGTLCVLINRLTEENDIAFRRDH